MIVQPIDSAGKNLPVKLRRPGLGLLVGVMLLLSVETWLHSDDFPYRFRSVFAAGRAMDKVLFVEANCPSLLIVGNSRADNAFDVGVVRRVAELPQLPRAFNLGLPGADARVLSGILDRLDSRRCLGGAGVQYVVLALDESLLQRVDSLGQDVYFASRRNLWADGQYHDLLKATLRLYGFTQNLRQLREPATLKRFIDACRGDVEPVGGSAATHLGYRAGFGGLQNRDSALLQDAGSMAPPDAANVKHLWRMLDLLKARSVQVAVAFPPLLNRELLYLDAERPQSAPYTLIAAELKQRGIPLLALDAGQTRNADEFVNAGHLNDLGAQRFSQLLGQALHQIWTREALTVNFAKPRPGTS